ncbi:uncharacterized protein LOC114963207 [Acropora millepora]|uniref:uncharacterized protein LOC114963207 n=1 Tax=Acropora millepora TaxID=45264 RepID=UPI001CF57590|nr:uncharacterized protein LOC114963207 [Acropora millepora]
MSSSNTDSENSFEYEDSDGCYVLEYDIAFEDGDLNDMWVTPSKSEGSVDSLDQIYADLCFDEINPFLATFNSLGSRITKERYGVHKYAFGRIRDTAATRSNTPIRHILDDLFTRLCAQLCRSVPPLTSLTKLDPLSFKLGGEPKGYVFSKL